MALSIEFEDAPRLVARADQLAAGLVAIKLEQGNLVRHRAVMREARHEEMRQQAAEQERNADLYGEELVDRRDMMRQGRGEGARDQRVRHQNDEVVDDRHPRRDPLNSLGRDRSRGVLTYG